MTSLPEILVTIQTKPFSIFLENLSWTNPMCSYNFSTLYVLAQWLLTWVLIWKLNSAWNWCLLLFIVELSYLAFISRECWIINPVILGGRSPPPAHVPAYNVSRRCDCIWKIFMEVSGILNKNSRKVWRFLDSKATFRDKEIFYFLASSQILRMVYFLN